MVLTQLSSSRAQISFLGISRVESYKALGMGTAQAPWTACGAASVCSWGNFPPCIRQCHIFNLSLLSLVLSPCTDLRDQLHLLNEWMMRSFFIQIV